MVDVEKLLALLPNQLLEKLAIAHQVDARNQVKLPGAVVFVCLLSVLTSHPLVTQRLLEEAYRKHHPVSGTTADHSSFGKRLATIPAAYFKDLFQHLYRTLGAQVTTGDQSALKLRLRFVDATVVSLSAKLLDFGIRLTHRRNGRAYSDKRLVKTVFELAEPAGAVEVVEVHSLPDLLHVCREQKEASDDVALGETMTKVAKPGDLFIFDRGCRSIAHLLALHRKGVFFLTPQRDQQLQTEALVWEAPGVALPLPPSDPKPSFRLLSVERAHFLARSYEVATRQEIREAFPLLVFSGERFDTRAQAWKPMVLLTNLPLSEDGMRAGPYELGEIPNLYRRRWEIETFFKFLKQHLGYQHLTSRTENGIRVMIYMTLIAALLLTWYKRESGIDRGWRSVKYWFAEDSRGHTILDRRTPCRNIR